MKVNFPGREFVLDVSVTNAASTKLRLHN